MNEELTIFQYCLGLLLIFLFYMSIFIICATESQHIGYLILFIFGYFIFS